MNVTGTRVMAVGVFDLLHAGHLHYLEQAKALGDHLTVVVAHDDTVRARKHDPVTPMAFRRRLVEGLKPVDEAIVGNAPDVPIFDILPAVRPDVIALGYHLAKPDEPDRRRCHLEIAEKTEKTLPHIGKPCFQPFVFRLQARQLFRLVVPAMA